MGLLCGRAGRLNTKNTGFRPGQFWQDNKLPLDVWALDMNWRNTSKDNLLPGAGPGHPFSESGSQDHYYDHPNSELFPGDGPYGSSFTEWFA